MKSMLPLLALITVATFASPVLACEQHQSHAALKTAEQVSPPPPKVVIEPAAQSVPASENVTAKDAAMSKPAWATGENCNRPRNQGKTVYLTQ
ncbi:hypothetical protein [Taklimakanibacter albus]|jgi:hypothetical protein|uniref:Uncharacterized protein n=1 Tax=Taklimakanibacter albus TaxID=2800327 RepID=A0ACC5R0R9_9HYPH|nr:hypothetical protein [Aestuariivirga sp. YIM B02566]MBK1866259.1 hypothetical protein [Aestuariivirga sp. YIM B02566]